MFPDIPVSVNIRNNKLYAIERNANMDVWYDFFKQNINKYPIKFVVICGFSEVDQRFRELDNVIIAKDNFTSIEQDLSLIQSSAFHLGSASGPASIALFGSQPYYICNTTLNLHIDHYNESMKMYNRDCRFTFSHNLQNNGTEPETVELLEEKFLEIWDVFDKEKWLNTKDNKNDAPENITWLR